MKMNELHPSKYLSAPDLNEDKATVTIKEVVMEEMQGGDDKPVIYFAELDKGFVANKTNCTTIATLYGDDSDDWVGEKITLFPTYTIFNKVNTPCIRIEPKRPGTKKPSAQKVAAAKPVAPQAREPGDDDEDIPDDIPY